jgi:hypothetical protein
MSPLASRPSRHLTYDQRWALRLGIDAAVREVFAERRYSHRFCSDCGWFLPKSAFPGGTERRLCHDCAALAEREGGEAA